MKQEKELIELAKSGDAEAFGDLMENCGEQIYNLSLRLTGNQADARDLYQNTFIRVYKNMDKFNQDSSFATWVYRITVNTWKNTVRYEKARNFFKHISIEGSRENGNCDQIESLPDTKINLELELEKKFNNEMVLKVMEGMDEKLKTVLILRDIEGKEYNEISEIADCPLGTVKSRISKARQIFRDKLIFHLKDKKEWIAENRN